MKKAGTSRRMFLRSAVLGAAATAAGGPVTATPFGEAVTGGASDPDRARLERLARRYGGELGAVKEVGR